MKELDASFLWYEERREGLGDRFISIIDKAFHLIELSPERLPLKAKSFREFVVDKFPYVIDYEYIEEEQKIIELHVFDTKRNPRFKFRRH
ncbi:MAG: type II toxin-antitoxin system RelE/ParE family toxin [Bacteroidales bacterium]|nr:type II toxin-antitoxin system RelE/ParE family toxin [Bacteroidales bacterium]